MDSNVSWMIREKIERTIKNLEKNNIEAYNVKNSKQLIELIDKLIPEGETVAVGGSMTLFETGIIDHIRSKNYNFLDRYKEGLSKEDIKDVFRKSFFADSYIVSTNALTENGELYNVDGNGNRVAAMLFGPDKVIVIAGINKIVKDVDEAIKRNKFVSAPINAKRLNKATPCTKVGYCMDCKSQDRICNEYTLIKRQGVKGRIKVIIVEEELGH